MASYEYNPRTRSTMYDNNDNNDRLEYSTAYHGAQGHINDHHYSFSDFNGEDCNNIERPAAAAATPTRPAVGSRWLSNLSSGPNGSALKRSGSVLHSRAKSLAAYVPKLNQSANTTPERAPQQPQQTNRIFSNLFSGESAPVHIGIAPASPTKEESEFVMEYKPTLTEMPNAPRRRSTAQTNTTSPSTTVGGRTAGWFSRKPTLPIISTAPKPQDDILALNINSALFPNGPADPLSPHAFNDLLLNATSLLQRMQTAYKEKVDYIASIHPEMDAQKEEVEEAETRSRHLKMQLEDMGRKASEQNRAMQELAVQLAEEKVKTQEARELARNAVKLARNKQDDEEDTPRRRKRGSAGSASDSGFESDMEYAESIMSGGRSGAETPLTPPTVILTHADVDDGHDWDTPLAKLRQRPTVSRQSTLSQLSGSTALSNQHPYIRGQQEVASRASADQLRGENRELKRRMDEMQAMLQGCIEFVDIVKG